MSWSLTCKLNCWRTWKKHHPPNWEPRLDWLKILFPNLWSLSGCHNLEPSRDALHMYFETFCWSTCWRDELTAVSGLGLWKRAWMCHALSDTAGWKTVKDQWSVIKHESVGCVTVIVVVTGVCCACVCCGCCGCVLLSYNKQPNKMQALSFVHFQIEDFPKDAELAQRMQAARAEMAIHDTVFRNCFATLKMNETLRNVFWNHQVLSYSTNNSITFLRAWSLPLFSENASRVQQVFVVCPAILQRFMTCSADVEDESIPNLHGCSESPSGTGEVFFGEVIKLPQ